MMNPSFLCPSLLELPSAHPFVIIPPYKGFDQFFPLHHILQILLASSMHLRRLYRKNGENGQGGCKFFWGGILKEQMMIPFRKLQRCPTSSETLRLRGHHRQWFLDVHVTYMQRSPLVLGRRVAHWLFVSHGYGVLDKTVSPAAVIPSE